MEMKKCKECGKLFLPKSIRSQYCDALHYRPCPVCGKLVEAKYLSDPARCCSKECQQALKKQNKPSIPSSSTPTVTDSGEIELDVVDGDTVVNVLSSVNKHTINAELSPEGQAILSDAEVRTYVGKSGCKFIQGHAYAVRVSRDNEYSRYKVSGYYDLTEDKKCDALSVHASMLSFNHFFLPISKKIIARR